MEGTPAKPPTTQCSTTLETASADITSRDTNLTEVSFLKLRDFPLSPNSTTPICSQVTEVVAATEEAVGEAEVDMMAAAAGKNIILLSQFQTVLVVIASCC